MTEKSEAQRERDLFIKTCLQGYDKIAHSIENDIRFPEEEGKVGEVYRVSLSVGTLADGRTMQFILEANMMEEEFIGFNNITIQYKTATQSLNQEEP